MHDNDIKKKFNTSTRNELSINNGDGIVNEARLYTLPDLPTLTV